MSAPLVPAAEHTLALLAATLKITGSLDPPPLADTAKVPPWLNTGFAGVATTAEMVCAALVIGTLNDAGAAFS